MNIPLTSNLQPFVISNDVNVVVAEVGEAQLGVEGNGVGVVAVHLQLNLVALKLGKG